ncbi:alpha/beta fold hydrolase [Conchiformibius steedae DSM 2580]|uniref:Alpha/beta fold hydrolase n=1 Tax=Conchiformibius steedae DSM 2580 TaxID=1121352 RepID=A0AAE9KY38_9NEIS|nr:alpha/beta fold hydrolase [Conchiformibius steedae]QMT34384.1 alpha/beta fold hydrolase [Conchiformibius steedae]URD67162.1 alpha/beta fold hydrolase [Conchiformibius steedae DSM 2580]
MPHFTPAPLIPPSWLTNGHAQTLYAKTLQAPPPAYRRELIADSYGEDLAAYDFVDAPQPDAPAVVLLHGLEGSSRSHYATALMHAVAAHGWHGVVAHFRSCGGVDARRTYHSGDTREVAHMLAVLRRRYRKLYVVGVSLGGNALAKYLGEQGDNALLDAAAVVSAPLDLPNAAAALERGLAWLLYTPYFLHTLLKKVPQPPQRCLSLGAFDRAYTAPIHGFASEHDYYARAAALPHLINITRPTLIINAQNDPFLPPPFLPQPHQVSASVQLLQPEHGGHCGFVSAGGRGHLRWLPDTVLKFFEASAADTL